MTVNILAIDGGGIRGIIPAMLLAELEARAGRPVSSLFQMVAGTSTGGIIAAGLTAPRSDGSPRYRAEHLVSLYLEEGPRIFSRSMWQRLRSGWGLLDQKYDDGALNDVLRGYLGETRVSQAVTGLLVTAYELQTRTPYVVKSWQAREQPQHDIAMWQAARATSAAPTYFNRLSSRPPKGIAAFR